MRIFAGKIIDMNMNKELELAYDLHYLKITILLQTNKTKIIL